MKLWLGWLCAVAAYACFSHAAAGGPARPWFSAALQLVLFGIVAYCGKAGSSAC